MYEELTKTYLDYLLTKGYHKVSSHRHYRQIKAFLLYLGKDIAAITTFDITQYYHYLRERPNHFNGKVVALTTVAHHIVSIELFYKMLLDMGKIAVIPEINIHYQTPASDFIREILSQEEIKNLYKVANKQEAILLHLGYGCGLRVSELAAVTREDIYVKDRFLIVPKGKFNKRRLIPLPPRIAKDLTLFLESIPLGQELMLNKRGTKMQKWTYNVVLKKLLLKSNIPTERIQKISIHSLRHSIATHLLENEMEVEKVSRFLGHSQLETTQIYTHISMQQLKKIKNDDS